MTRWLVALWIAAMCAGCAAFEQKPDDLQRKLSDPMGGHLYLPDPQMEH